MLSPVRLRIAVLHAAFNEARRESFARLMADLAPQCERPDVDLHVYHEVTRRGCLAPWLRILSDARDASLGANGHSSPDGRSPKFAPTHLVFLPDDVLLCRNFVEALVRATAARPDEVLCHQSNHRDAPAALRDGFRWYTTPDGFTAFAGTLPVPFVRDHLAWRKTRLYDPSDASHTAPDDGVNMHLMATGRRCYKSLPSLVQHDDPGGSLVGSETDINVRVSLAWEPERDLAALDWAGGRVEHLRRTYRGSHWRLLFDTHPASWSVDLVERAYDVERGDDEPPSPSYKTWTREMVFAGEYERRATAWSAEHPHLVIGIPEYGAMVHAMRRSLARSKAALAARGVRVTELVVPGDSLITRARNRLVHQFMKTSGTHLLMWDGDVECLDEEAACKMLALTLPSEDGTAAGYPVLGGLYPLRDMSGEVCGNLPPKSGGRPGEKTIVIETDGTCPMLHLGTGFLLARRDVYERLMLLHPETLHEQDCGPERGEPAFALFDCAVAENGRPGARRQYRSEDWVFSDRCRAAGFEVRAYVPPRFRHWGLLPADGHALERWGLAQRQPASGTRQPGRAKAREDESVGEKT